MSAKKQTVNTLRGTYLVVGAGRMGGALITGWLASKTAPQARDIIILDPAPRQAAQSAIAAGAKHVSEPCSMPDVKCVLLAIKPQMFDQIAPALAQFLPEACLVVSVLAGTSLSQLQTCFKTQRVVRAMPNTPAAIGAGITGFTCGEGVTPAQKDEVKQLLSVTGRVHEVAGDDQINMITAISGSGPAYVFYMVEALEAAAIRIGFPPDLAGEFARQTITGAGTLLDSSSESATALRQAVTSPNGTTQAALEILMAETGLAPIMRETVKAAYERAKALAKP